MRVFVAGASGAVGSRLVPLLVAAGHEVVGTSRKPERLGAIEAAGATGVVMDALPVSGERGSLSYDDRFWGDNSVADGAVSAKTGWIETGYTLSGVVRAQDGSTLTFAIYALGDVSDDTKQAIDTLTTGFFLCGDNLSNR